MDQKLELNIVPRTKVSDLSLQGTLLPIQSFPGPKSCYMLMGLRSREGCLCPESRVLSLFGGAGSRFRLMS